MVAQTTNGKNGLTLKEDDSLSDSSEEFLYGPGIVNKLKTKYLSMILREQKRHSRPSINNFLNLSRATSFENMIEGGDDNLTKEEEPVRNANTKTDNVNMNSQTVLIRKPLGLNSHHGMKFLESKSLETMKRARSMDTLLKSETRPSVKNFGCKSSRPNKEKSLNGNDCFTNNAKPIASIGLVNENVIIVENLPVSSSKPSGSCNQVSEVPSNKPQNQLKGSISISGDKELPPPDLVKQTLKIFETSPKKRSKPQIQTSLTKRLSESSASASMKTSSHINKTIDKTKTVLNKPTLSPKPILSPEKLKPRSKVGSPKKCQYRSNSNNANVSCAVNSMSPNSPTKTSVIERQQSLETIKKSNTGTLNNEKSNGIENVAKVLSPVNISPVAAASSCEQDSSSPTAQNRSNSNDNIHIEGESNFLKKLDVLEEVDSSECPKPVPETALENIRQGGFSVQFSFNNDNYQKSSISKSYLPASRNPPQALNTSLVSRNVEKSPPIANVAPLRSSSSPHTKQVGIIRPLVTTKTQTSLISSPTLTDQEIEKNLINCVKSIEQPISKVVVSIKALPDNVVLGSVSSDVVSNKNVSLPRSCSNSQNKTQGLWDEKLWHNAQNTIVFNFSDRKEVPDYIENDGLILKGKRDRPRPGEGGIILLDNASEETSTDAEDFLNSDPPSPCDVTFVGDNVLINGKSNLKKSPKQVKLRIKFNDEATTMFEYPSEASLVEEDTSQPEACHSEASSPASTSAPTLPQAIGGGGALGAYTPRKTGAGDWQLGVTPVLPPNIHTTTQSMQSEEDHIKPAPPESTTAWSEDTASDLLF